MPTMPEKSIHLIIADPPYNIGKDKKWDKWKKQGDYIEWMGLVFLECQRVLKDNGSFYWFHNDMEQIAELMIWLKQNTRFIFKQMIIWDKYNGSKWNQLNAIVYSNKNRNYSKQAEYCFFYTFQDETGLTTVMLDTNNFSTLRKYFKDYQEALGLNKKQIIEQIGQKADHCFRWVSSQWDLPTEETYKQLGRLPLKHEFLRREYEDLRREYEDLRREYEDLRYTFNNQGMPSIWQYTIEKPNGHITPKPTFLIENIVKHSSNKGDIILDPFAGSGTTGVVCMNLNRKCILIEKELQYIEIINKRLGQKQLPI